VETSASVAGSTAAAGTLSADEVVGGAVLVVAVGAYRRTVSASLLLVILYVV
jgi:hypothetical protein